MSCANEDQQSDALYDNLADLHCRSFHNSLRRSCSACRALRQKTTGIQSSQQGTKKNCKRRSVSVILWVISASEVIHEQYVQVALEFLKYIKNNGYPLYWKMYVFRLTASVESWKLWLYVCCANSAFLYLCIIDFWILSA